MPLTECRRVRDGDFLLGTFFLVVIMTPPHWPASCTAAPIKTSYRPCGIPSPASLSRPNPKFAPRRSLVTNVRPPPSKGPFRSSPRFATVGSVFSPGRLPDNQDRTLSEDPHAARFSARLILMGITVAPAIVAYHQPMDSEEDDFDESRDSDSSVAFARTSSGFFVCGCLQLAPSRAPTLPIRPFLPILNRIQ